MRLFDHKPEEAVARGQVGAMLQDAGLPGKVKVADLVGWMRRMYADPQPLGDALQLAVLEHVASRQVQWLSGGQRQRVRLACAWSATRTSLSSTNRPQLSAGAGRSGIGSER